MEFGLPRENVEITVFAAMLNASVSTQTNEKPGRLSRIRAPANLFPELIHWFTYLNCAPARPTKAPMELQVIGARGSFLFAGGD